ncbi:ribose-5-phosphate isomerase A [Paenibacillus baekrokdamisoli]|uniref:Ribose-5-phosphate isomerase A n=1 Tax=Paenibacillus baekrokdamisoli TaxID=1712516 RepID=A0A3G9J699_9BACL|nr:ribose-5-phosphate isomerase RpiA [Paenibacillus baekrokdamisoli]MBB3070286.1 ribose 5-phosphate isomerase A [Paenibacillus baekrokdamisoli]BBH21291.1 ribose-5-phosphate isomerase A [Paenibacillus baekrokdamisoli]
MNSKKLAAEHAVQFIKSGMIVGLGTGSTAHFAIHAIGARVQAGLTIQAIATSEQSEALARELEIPIVSFQEVNEIDLTIDGADEVDSDLNVIKGGGGALLREKIVASASRELIIIVDESKVVSQLGAFPLPIEVVPFGIEMTMKKLAALLECPLTVRQSGNKPFVTDNEHYIVDCHTGSIADAGKLTRELNMIPGVVENGLFIGMAAKVIVGYMDGAVRELNHT